MRGGRIDRVLERLLSRADKALDDLVGVRRAPANNQLDASELVAATRVVLALLDVLDGVADDARDRGREWRRDVLTRLGGMVSKAEGKEAAALPVDRLKRIVRIVNEVGG